MARCPVCNSEYISGESDRCSVCNWDLKSYPLPRTGKFRKIFQEKERSYLEWARHAWQRLEEERSLQEESAHFPHSGKIPNLEAEVNELRSQMKQAAAETNALRTELAVAKQERAFLTSQIEWIFARLEAANLEEMQESIWQMQEWANAIYDDQIYNNKTHNEQPESYLSSEVGIDYSPLEKLLGSGTWRKADELTWQIMLEVANREAEGWLRIEDIEAFPSTDLGTINWLWEYYSSGRFGCSVQQRIWETAAKDYTEFCYRVGWRVKENWLYYEDLNCSLNSPEGYLPIIAWRKRSCYGVGSISAGETIAALLSRF